MMKIKRLATMNNIPITGFDESPLSLKLLSHSTDKPKKNHSCNNQYPSNNFGDNWELLFCQRWNEDDIYAALSYAADRKNKSLQMPYETVIWSEHFIQDT